MELTEKTATQESPFNALRLVKEDGSEFWSARDLQDLLGYTEWRKFRGAIERGQMAALNMGEERVSEHFVGAAKTQKSRNQHGEIEMQVDDFHLSRYAAYLTAMNSDPSKREVAAAQHYFAVRTREAEVGPRAKEVDYLSLEPGQLVAMAGALDDKADALRELAGVMVRLKDAEQRFDRAQSGQEFNPFQSPEAPVVSSRGHTRLEQILPWLTASNLRKSEDGQWWQTTTREVCIGAMRRDPQGVTGFDQAEAARALRQLGWEKGTDPGVWQKRV